MVVNDDGSVAGIVTPMDVLRALVRGDDLGGSVAETAPLAFVDLRDLA